MGKRPKFIYTIPNFQNPTGVTLSLERRRGLLELAKEYDFLIVEDNPYGEISFGEEPVPHIKSLDDEGRVIYLGSFSKILSPGVRVGWMAGNGALIRQIAVAKQGTDLCSSSLGMKVALKPSGPASSRPISILCAFCTGGGGILCSGSGRLYA